MRVRTFATLRDLMKTSEIQFPLEGKSSVREVLRSLAGRYPDFAKKLWDAGEQPTGQITVLLNGRSIDYLKGLETEVGETDTISLFPPVGGG